MKYITVIVSILLLCSFFSRAEDALFIFIFGGGIQQTTDQKKQDAENFDICPIDPPLGKDHVWVVIVEGNRFKRLGLWSNMSDDAKREVQSYIKSGGKVEDALNDDTQLLVCGTNDENDPRVLELKQRGCSLII